MTDYTLEIELQSDTAFGMGSGVSGLVDSEIQHDVKGLPTLSGRAIKGLLVNECSEILFALPSSQQELWERVAIDLFGKRGEMLDDAAGVFISDATIATDLMSAIHADPALSRQDILTSLTAIRHQTAMNVMGAPQDEALRATRVLVRGLTLYSCVSFTSESEEQKSLFAACVMSLRRAGLNRTRGKGRSKLRITDRALNPEEFSQATGTFEDMAPEWFRKFNEEVAA